MRHTFLFSAFSVTALGLVSAETLTLENQSIQRVLNIDKAGVTTSGIHNKQAKRELQPTACAEFSLRLSEGTDKEGTDFTLTSKDFAYSKTLKKDKGHVAVELLNEKHGLKVVAHYTLEDDAFYMRKYLEITSRKKVCLERVDVEALSLTDAYQPYQEKKITARAPWQWKPGLGQPLFTTKTGTFWGIEFPASYNYVDGEKLRCGYLHGRMLEPGKTYTSYAAVMGVSDDPAFTSDAFYEYIDQVRVRPLRLQTQYNSWFDYHGGVTREAFAKSVNKVNEELCVKRGVTPLKAYVIDDGWQDSNKKSDWSDQVWKVNGKFDSDFGSSQKTVKSAKSTLGLWLSPGCNFGARGAVPAMREKGWGGLTNYMSLANTKYMDMLEKRMVQLAKEETTYFKLDGCFGHLNIRDFDIDGAANGVPTMPQLGTKGWSSDDKRLNDPKYDELKSYYLVVGTERMMKIFEGMGKANPDVYIVISNGAYLSPWWLMHVDAVWMINAGDAAGGSSRTKELVYRDGVYHNIWAKERTHYPMNSLFNHEPKKTKSHEPKDVFRKYLYMNMSRGTGFVELYLKTFNLKEYDWDVLAEGMLWVEDVFPTFKRSRMHGGDPKKGEVYGFTAWLEKRGYISIHNPSDSAQDYKITLNRKFGLIPGAQSYVLSSPIDDSLQGLKKQYAYGDVIQLTLKPGEIRILNFDHEKRDWSKLKALQTRTAADFVPGPNAGKKKVENKKHVAVSLAGHPLLGRWYYEAGGKHSREFTADGKCILRKGNKEIWTKTCTSKDADSVTVENRYQHHLKGNTLVIEGRYRAKKR
ncbi:hypothetical protein HW115_05735 [Verrucomicrobiaceae bacterium N1E253]|uniref:Alpha-galactosidase n=1 Tax=Oceaniferula marina TaxID=2748318 RepID=A0A851GGX8_9BACT|nr:hypothetical protein [Oceaniferula marina]NWK55101.1 hypothetical protein [Oceaniferula marina]